MQPPAFRGQTGALKEKVSVPKWQLVGSQRDSHQGMVCYCAEGRLDRNADMDSVSELRSSRENPG